MPSTAWLGSKPPLQHCHDRPFQRLAAPSLTDIETLAAEAYACLPEHFRKLCEGLIIRVEDFPSTEVLDSMKAESEFDLLGLFQG
ncbi:MAG: metallopeptidase family protein, partial [Pseudolabrys sp.]